MNNLEVDPDDDEPRVFSYAAGARVLIGLAGVIGMAYQYNRGENDMKLADKSDASAVQIIQLWTPHIFHAIIIIGIVISLYIATRWAD